MVLALRSVLDLYFILNAIGFKNICRFIAHGDSASGRTLCIEQTGLQKRSKHFNKNAAWVRNFINTNMIEIIHTATEELTSNALTKRVTEREQQCPTHTQLTTTTYNIYIEQTQPYNIYVEQVARS